MTKLLKSFQAEVDSLSRRSKAGEAAFLNLYKTIVESPGLWVAKFGLLLGKVMRVFHSDPVPALEQVLMWQKKAQEASDAKLEARNLRETLQQYSAEFAEVKNQGRRSVAAVLTVTCMITRNQTIIYIFVWNNLHTDR